MTAVLVVAGGVCGALGAKAGPGTSAKLLEVEKRWCHGESGGDLLLSMKVGRRDTRARAVAQKCAIEPQAK